MIQDVSRRRPAVPQRLKRGAYLIPSLFTIANMLLGFYAIVCGLRGQFHSLVGAGAARDRSGWGADLSNAAATLPGNCRFGCDERREVFPWQP